MPAQARGREGGGETSIGCAVRPESSSCDSSQSHTSLASIVSSVKWDDTAAWQAPCIAHSRCSLGGASHLCRQRGGMGWAQVSNHQGCYPPAPTKLPFLSGSLEASSP